ESPPSAICCSRKRRAAAIEISDSDRKALARMSSAISARVTGRSMRRVPVQGVAMGSSFADAEETAPAAQLGQLTDQHGKVFVTLDRVQMLGVDDQQRRVVVVVEEAAVGFGQGPQVGLGDVGLH